MSNDKSARAKEIIGELRYVTVASVTADGLPWNSPVFAAYDDDYNFYWGSYIHSQHSENIRTNKNVFLVMYDSTVPVGKGEGVYIQATATELDDPTEIAAAHKLLQDRRKLPYWRLSQAQGEAPISLFKATPQHVWMNDEGQVDGHYIDTRTEIQL